MGTKAKDNWFIGNRYYIQTIMEAELQRSLGNKGIAHPSKGKTPELGSPDQCLLLLMISNMKNSTNYPSLDPDSCGSGVEKSHLGENRSQTLLHLVIALNMVLPVVAGKKITVSWLGDTHLNC